MDGAHILQAIAGADPLDNYTSAIPYSKLPDYVAACKLSALSGSRIGVPRDVISLRSDNTSTPVIEAFEQALDVFRAAGAVVVDTSFLAAAEFFNSTLPNQVLAADFVVNLQSYLDALTHNPHNISSLAALRDFTRSFPLEDYPTLDTSVWDAALSNWNNTDPRFWPVYQEVMYYGAGGGLLGAIDRDHLDAVVLPATFSSNYAATVGAPIVTVPLGFYAADTPLTKNEWGLFDTGPNIPYVTAIL